MGYKIWKYSTDNDNNGSYKNKQIKILTLILIIVLVTAFLAVLFMISQKNNASDVYVKWGSFVVIAIVVILIVFLCLKRGTDSQGMLLAFARNRNGELFLFDYRSEALKQLTNTVLKSGGNSIKAGVNYYINSKRYQREIDLINNNHILEKIMKSGQVYPFGIKISSVQDIKDKDNHFDIRCTLIGQQGNFVKHRIVIPKNYGNIDELMLYFERLI